MTTSYLMHHGVKGQKWGVRKYQYKDGTLTAEGKRRYRSSDRTNNVLKKGVSSGLDAYYASRRTKDLKDSKVGKEYVDTYIYKNSSLFRLQNEPEFERYPFYATFMRDDTKKYIGLLPKQLDKKSASVEQLGDKDHPIYHLKFVNTDKLRIPSEKELTNTVKTLLKDSEFKSDAAMSISNAASIMHLPSQQMLFRSASKAMTKKTEDMTDSDYRDVYKAINLSLRNHGPHEIKMQNTFYGALKEHNYQALLDINDKTYSTFRSKAPVIVFDVDKVKLQSITTLSRDSINRMHAIYAPKRAIRLASDQTAGVIAKCAGMRITRAADYTVNKMVNYLVEDDENIQS